jgi:hypothetical protein
MKEKITYRVRNWKDYNRSLINRGNFKKLGKSQLTLLLTRQG